MAKKVFTPEQILAKLRQIEVATAQGMSVPGSRDFGCELLPLATGIRRTETRPGKAVEGVGRENARLKKVAADLSLEKAMLQEVASGNF